MLANIVTLSNRAAAKFFSYMIDFQAQNESAFWAETHSWCDNIRRPFLVGNG
jgi:hypothetical protein